jgi:hypothetical protein
MEKFSEWKNTTSGHLGVVKHDDEGKPQGVSVRPKGTVLLSEKDRVATANAPANPANNPLSNGALVCVTAEADMTHRRPIGDAERTSEPEPEPEATPEAEAGQETGAAVSPQGEAPKGQAAPHEETATPPPPGGVTEPVKPSVEQPARVRVTQDEDVAPITPTPTPKPQT